MKKWIGAALLLLLVLLSACGGPKISEETAAADFGPTVRLYSRDLPVHSVRVDERQEGEDKNTLTLVLTVEAGDAEVDFRGGYTMAYAKQNKEWSCAGVYSDFDRDYRLVPLAALPEEEALKDLGEGTVITGSAQDLENLACSSDYIQQQDFKYVSITQAGSRNYTYDERKFSWVQGVSEEPRVQAEWDILGEWISTGGSGTLTKNWSLPITVDITAVGADTVTLTANYNGRGGVIFQGEVPLDPLTGIDAWFENGWDSFGFVLTPDKGVVTGTGLRSNEGMEKRALVDIPEPVTPADTEFTYDLDPAAKTATFRSYKGAEPYLRIPDRFDGCAVTAIGDEAFARNKNLVQVVLPETVISRFTSIGNLTDNSTSYRVYIWIGTLAMLKDYWLCGIGPGDGAFNMVYPAYSYKGIVAPHAHNLCLQIVCDAGIAALGVFLLLLFVYFRMLCSAMSREKDPASRLLQIAFTAGVCGFLVQAMTDYSFYNYRVMFLFWAVLALGAACARRTSLPEGSIFV